MAVQAQLICEMHGKRFSTCDTKTLEQFAYRRITYFAYQQKQSVLEPVTTTLYANKRNASGSALRVINCSSSSSQHITRQLLCKEWYCESYSLTFGSTSDNVPTHNDILTEQLIFQFALQLLICFIYCYIVSVFNLVKLKNLITLFVQYLFNLKYVQF